MAAPALALALLLFLQGCHLLTVLCANVDPGQLPNAFVYIQTWDSSASGGPPVYLALNCSTSQVSLYSSSSPPDPALSKFKFLPDRATFKFLPSGNCSKPALDYNIQSAECPRKYLRLDTSGGTATGTYNDGFGQASGTSTVDASATFRPVPQLAPAGAGFYSLQSDAVGYAYLRLDVPNNAVNAQNGIGPFERLTINVFP